MNVILTSYGHSETTELAYVQKINTSNNIA